MLAQKLSRIKSDTIDLQTLVQALQESGFQCNEGEVTVLFKIMNVNITDQDHAGMTSIPEFMRIADLETHCWGDNGRACVKVNDSLRVHQMHRVLVQSLTTPEQTLAEIHISMARMHHDRAHCILAKWMHSSVEKTLEHDSHWPSLSDLLERCYKSLCGPDAYSGCNLRGLDKDRESYRCQRTVHYEACGAVRGVVATGAANSSSSTSDRFVDAIAEAANAGLGYWSGRQFSRLAGSACRTSQDNATHLPTSPSDSSQPETRSHCRYFPTVAEVKL